MYISPVNHGSKLSYQINLPIKTSENNHRALIQPMTQNFGVFVFVCCEQIYTLFSINKKTGA